MTTLKVRFDGRVLIPEEPVSLPTDRVIEVQINSEEVGESNVAPLAKLAELAANFPIDPNAPTDGAAQHDHYLYNTPKRK